MSTVLLEVENLAVRFRNDRGEVNAVSDVALTISAGETLAVVGESGSGKSVTALAVMGLHSKHGTRIDGSIRLHTGGVSRDLLTLDPEAMRKVRGKDIAMIFQEPMTSLNPVTTIGAQITEAVQLHSPMDRRSAMDEACRLLELVGIPAARERLSVYPHQLSGGMRQRVMIAIALAGDPAILIADEPTTALDVTIQAQILDLLRRLQEKTGMAVMFITHNLGVVAEIADRVMVMYSGRVVEQADVRSLFERPLMPYTTGLLGSVPRMELAGLRSGALAAIPGNVPDQSHPPNGCAFHPRCSHYVAGPCDSSLPALEVASAGRLVRCARWRELAQEGAA